MNRPRVGFCISVSFLILAGAARPAFANTFTIDPGTATDNDQIKFTNAINSAVAGDTIFVHGGTYNLTGQLTLSKVGSAALPFNIVAVAGETPVLDYRGQSIGGRGMLVSGQFWNVKGLTVQYAGDNGVLVSGSNNTIQQVVARQSQDSGFSIQSVSSSIPSNNLILNCDSYGNYDNAAFGENADGFAVKFRGLGAGNVLRGDRSWNNADDGYDFWQAEHGVTVQNCWSFHNGIGSMFVGAATYNGDGNGIKLGHDSGTHTLSNMLIWGNPANGIDVNGNATQLEGDPPTITHGVTIYNNTAFNNGGKNFNFDENPTTATPPTTHTLRNNLSINVTSQGTVSSNFTVQAGNTADHNTWNTGFPGSGVTPADLISITDPVTTNGLFHPTTDRLLDSNPSHTTPTYGTGAAVGPRRPDGSLPILPFMRLKWGSHLIDTGVNVGLPFVYSAPDLGAFEAIRPGDADLDGDTDGVDIGTWAVNFTGELGGTGSMDWTQGDWDFDGDVDGVDAGLWAQFFTGELGGGGAGAVSIDQPLSPQVVAILRGLGITVVPEPTGAMCAFLAMAAASICRRSRRFG